MSLSKGIVGLLVGSLLFACGGAPNGSDQSAADVKSAPPTVIRGQLAKGESTPVQIVEQQGPEDADRIDVDMTKTKLAGAEARLLDVFGGKEFWIRGALTKRVVGSVAGSQISRDVLQAATVATVQNDHASGDGILRKSGGSFLVEVKDGSGNNADDSGSFQVDVSSLKVDVESFVGKKVHVEGLSLQEITGVIQGTHFISKDLIIASSIK
jgi:hypothetical protein